MKYNTRLPLPEPYGRVTMHTVSGLEFFYRHPEPPYLDTAKSCTVVYTGEALHAHAAAVSAADNAALRADAERYRFLRDVAWHEGALLPFLERYGPFEWDDVIDEARGEK